VNKSLTQDGRFLINYIWL